MLRELQKIFDELARERPAGPKGHAPVWNGACRRCGVFKSTYLTGYVYHKRNAAGTVDEVYVKGERVCHYCGGRT